MSDGRAEALMANEYCRRGRLSQLCFRIIASHRLNERLAV